MRSLGILSVPYFPTVEFNVACFPFSFQSQWIRIGGQACEPASYLALEDVNSNSDLLPGFRLTLHSNDSEVCISTLDVLLRLHNAYKFINSIRHVGTAKKKKKNNEKTTVEVQTKKANRKNKNIN